jgi:hypothetical protein
LKNLGSAITLSSQRPSPFCHPALRDGSLKMSKMLKVLKVLKQLIEHLASLAGWYSSCGGETSVTSRQVRPSPFCHPALRDGSLKMSKMLKVLKVLKQLIEHLASLAGWCSSCGGETSVTSRQVLRLWS